MKIAGYISILLLLALACAGRGNRAKAEGDLKDKISLFHRQISDYQHLIDMYNSGLQKEFFSVLDTFYVPCNYVKIDSNYEKNYGYYSPSWRLEIPEDSMLVTELVMDKDERLLDIIMNQVLLKGEHAFFCWYDDSYMTEMQYYWVRIGSENEFRKIPVIR
jgi:hypothetical protein